MVQVNGQNTLEIAEMPQILDPSCLYSFQLKWTDLKFVSSSSIQFTQKQRRISLKAKIVGKSTLHLKDSKSIFFLKIHCLEVVDHHVPPQHLLTAFVFYSERNHSVALMYFKSFLVGNGVILLDLRPAKMTLNGNTRNVLQFLPDESSVYCQESILSSDWRVSVPFVSSEWSSSISSNSTLFSVEHQTATYKGIITHIQDSHYAVYVLDHRHLLYLPRHLTQDQPFGFRLGSELMIQNAHVVQLNYLSLDNHWNPQYSTCIILLSCEFGSVLNSKYSSICHGSYQTQKDAEYTSIHGLSRIVMEQLGRQLSFHLNQDLSQSPLLLQTFQQMGISIPSVKGNFLDTHDDCPYLNTPSLKVFFVPIGQLKDVPDIELLAALEGRYSARIQRSNLCTLVDIKLVGYLEVNRFGQWEIRDGNDSISVHIIGTFDNGSFCYISDFIWVKERWTVTDNDPIEKVYLEVQSTDIVPLSLFRKRTLELKEEDSLTRALFYITHISIPFVSLNPEDKCVSTIHVRGTLLMNDNVSSTEISTELPSHFYPSVSKYRVGQFYVLDKVVIKGRLQKLEFSQCSTMTEYQPQPNDSFYSVWRKEHVRLFDRLQPLLERQDLSIFLKGNGREILINVDCIITKTEIKPETTETSMFYDPEALNYYYPGKCCILTVKEVVTDTSFLIYLDLGIFLMTFLQFSKGQLIRFWKLKLRKGPKTLYGTWSTETRMEELETNKIVEPEPSVIHRMRLWHFFTKLNAPDEAWIFGQIVDIHKFEIFFTCSKCRSALINDGCVKCKLDPQSVQTMPSCYLVLMVDDGTCLAQLTMKQYSWANIIFSHHPDWNSSKDSFLKHAQDVKRLEFDAFDSKTSHSSIGERLKSMCTSKSWFKSFQFKVCRKTDPIIVNKGAFYDILDLEKIRSSHYRDRHKVNIPTLTYPRFTCHVLDVQPMEFRRVTWA